MKMESIITSKRFIVRSLDHENVVELLIRNGADVNSLDRTSRSPLYLATENGIKEFEKIENK